ncbi:Glucose/arabinose dehydrogenase, beta-propeller fold [Carnobacterium alterfunditum]|uniref:Glucose/arabinose dehydrogenase, beta-propeller fold n=1 Tax=Carnobacterium alterfunditum TaxID=28230 RepID=A0A1N6HMU7_9LACT|nr:PQQ-dependent sugar dehydrogenase [Carnobacterium alterfunditum]SIO21009.1 Glucose/arabinose dehydrogenase, beta-propeller fold [Carnobacterium alterfunditum]
MKYLSVYLLSAVVLLGACAPAEETSKVTSSETSSSETTSTEESSDSSKQSSQTTETKSFEPLDHELVEAYPNLTFDQPLHYTTADDGTNQVFVVERTGKIKVFENEEEATEAKVVVDLSTKIDFNGQEKGLLGLAFDPEFEENGYFYVNYTTKETTVISRFTTDPTNVAEVDLTSEVILLEFPQPYANHNGGHLAFGPDGYLYIATGDGGSGGDPQRNAQDLTKIYGKLLRIDINAADGDKNYGIPDDNPYSDNTTGYVEEIFAYGLRNPWKFNFDEKRDLLIAADVGQNAMEEINLIEKGGNYGWNIMEGTLEHRASDEADMTELEAPIWEYDHSLGQSITGGYTYYGEENPSLDGVYLYGDFITGKIWGLWLDEDQQVENVELADTELMISSFGVDEQGELIIVDFNGKLYKLTEQE